MKFTRQTFASISLAFSFLLLLHLLSVQSVAEHHHREHHHAQKHHKSNHHHKSNLSAYYHGGHHGHHHHGHHSQHQGKLHAQRHGVHHQQKKHQKHHSKHSGAHHTKGAKHSSVKRGSASPISSIVKGDQVYQNEQKLTDHNIDRMIKAKFNHHKQLKIIPSNKSGWACVPTRPVKLRSNTETFAIGSCLVANNSKFTQQYSKIKSSDNLTFVIPADLGMPSGTVGKFVYDKSCKGLRLVSVSSAEQASTVASAISQSAAACPVHYAPAMAANNQQDSKSLSTKKKLGTCQKKFGLNWEMDGALCYKKCRDGYAGAGPVCWSKCPHGFTEFASFCQKPEPYGRGTGHFTKHACEHHGHHCEKNGLLYYPKCRDSFHNVGCCICSPNCPDGMSDTGTGCTRHSYGRGVGKTPMSGKEIALITGLAVADVVVTAGLVTLTMGVATGPALAMDAAIDGSVLAGVGLEEGAAVGMGAAEAEGSMVAGSMEAESMYTLSLPATAGNMDVGMAVANVGEEGFEVIGEDEAFWNVEVEAFEEEYGVEAEGNEITIEGDDEVTGGDTADIDMSEDDDELDTGDFYGDGDEEVDASGADGDGDTADTEELYGEGDKVTEDDDSDLYGN